MDTIHGTWDHSPRAVTLIGAHHHLWDLSRKKHPNLIGERRHDFFRGDDSALRRNYLPEDYKRDAAGAVRSANRRNSATGSSGRTKAFRRLQISARGRATSIRGRAAPPAAPPTARVSW